tara:strand:- start:1973 stop:2128 length:156 start_codon:yes stop_codon:yes gene_type:complete
MIEAANIGVSPSGKAAAFDAAMRRFESCHPNQIQKDYLSGPIAIHIVDMGT